MLKMSLHWHLYYDFQSHFAHTKCAEHIKQRDAFSEITNSIPHSWDKPEASTLALMVGLVLWLSSVLQKAVLITAIAHGICIAQTAIPPSKKAAPVNNVRPA